MQEPKIGAVLHHKLDYFGINRFKAVLKTSLRVIMLEQKLDFTALYVEETLVNQVFFAFKIVVNTPCRDLSFFRNQWLSDELDVLGGAAEELAAKLETLNQQVNVNTDKIFFDDVQAGLRQQRMDVGHTTVGRVFDWQHGKLGFTAAAGFDCVLERAARQHVKIRPGLSASLM